MSQSNSSFLQSTNKNFFSGSLSVCAYCAAIGQESIGHDKFTCNRLAALNPCEYCGAEGVNNHTKSHCPSKPRVSLQLRPSYR